jgi:uncharacterized protein
MNATSLPVTFANKQGFRLFGILHQPKDVESGTPAILLLSPGVKTRVAPHGLYKKMAETFVEMGFPVLRFDFYGLGDSEGEVSETLLADLYGTIQVGRYVDDTIAAMNWMEQTYGVRRFIVAGLCGGAITGLLTAERDARVDSLLALAIPAIVEGSQVDSAKYMTAGQLEAIREGYLSKLNPLNAQTWSALFRFVSFRTDYRLLASAMIKPVQQKLGRQQTAASAAPEESDNTNALFAPAFFRMMRSGRRVLFIFAGADRLHWEFETKFAGRHQEKLGQFTKLFGIHVTDRANHIFSMPEWQRDMLDQCRRWLEAVRVDGRDAQSRAV